MNVWNNIKLEWCVKKIEMKTFYEMQTVHFKTMHIKLHDRCQICKLWRLHAIRYVPQKLPERRKGINFKSISSNKMVWWKKIESSVFIFVVKLNKMAVFDRKFDWISWAIWKMMRVLWFVQQLEQLRKSS